MSQKKFENWSAFELKFSKASAFELVFFDTSDFDIKSLQRVKFWVEKNTTH